MKTPTTPFSIDVQERVKINRTFLESQGFSLKEEYPLFETFEHSKNGSIVCSIGLDGSFSISELHWCNQTPEKYFYTINPNLTEEDYLTIVKLLNIQIPKPQMQY